MTTPEYKQLKAFARVDGAVLSVWWLLSFGCYVIGLTSPIYGLVSFFLAVNTPFFAARRLRRFRDNALDGFISLLRGWAYVVLIFFHAGIVFAIGQYVYFNFIDDGHLVQSLYKMLSTPEAEEMIKQYGMADSLGESLHELQQMRPIDIAINILTFNISLGIILGLPIAAWMRRQQSEEQK